MNKIEVDLYMCLLHEGIPIGPAYIYYTDPNPELQSKSFEGIGMFTNGKLHMGPFLCRCGNKKKKLFTQMIDGRPADNFYATYFLEDGRKLNVDDF